MIKSFRVREATKADIPILLLFEQGIIIAERPFDPTLAKDPISYYDLTSYIERSDTRVIIVEDTLTHTIVSSGYGQVRKGMPYHIHDEFIYLGFMYTLPEYRGQGLNRMIIHDLSEWAVSLGLFELRLEVYAHNETAIRAYEKSGFTPNLLEMRINTKPSN